MGVTARTHTGTEGRGDIMTILHLLLVLSLLLQLTVSRYSNPGDMNESFIIGSSDCARHQVWDATTRRCVTPENGPCPRECSWITDRRGSTRCVHRSGRRCSRRSRPHAVSHGSESGAGYRRRGRSY